MSIASNYTFDSISRIGNDSCYMDQNNIQNVRAANYLLQNYFASDCTMSNPIGFATNQPGVNYTGGHQVGAGGCNIDQNTQMMVGSLGGLHPKCRIMLQQRPFATVPFLGKGYVDPLVEAQVQQGEYIENKKSLNHVSEVNWASYSQTPLLADVANRVTNPSFCIESDAKSDWVRGGVASREMTRDTSKSAVLSTNSDSASTYDSGISSWFSGW
jgi:hypothetical protein